MKIEDIEKLIAEATEGPWYHVNLEHEWSDEIYNEPIVTSLENGIACTYGKGTSKSVANAKFIAASRSLMPKLIAVAKAVKYDLRQLRMLGFLELTRALEELEKEIERKKNESRSS